ncbi:MAG: hypothetical protein ACRD3V_02125, partial [Vicinamibacteria bacterium]
GCVWAEPDAEAAARFLRLLFDEPEQGRRLGSAAAAEIRRGYAPEAVARKAVARLELIRSRIHGTFASGDDTKERSKCAS